MKLSKGLTIGALALFLMAPAALGQQDQVVEGIEEISSNLDQQLFHAVRKGEAGKTARLIAQGADVNAVLPGDGTPLIAAARAGDMGMLASLLAAGADVNLAVEGDGAPLIAAAARGHLPIMARLISSGADVDIMSESDGTPLIKAAAAGQVKAVQALLAAGAAVDFIAPSDETALINAAQAGQLEAVKILVEAGADPSLRALANPDTKPEWRTPLGEAEKNDHAAVADYLRAQIAGLNESASQ